MKLSLQFQMDLIHKITKLIAQDMISVKCFFQLICIACCITDQLSVKHYYSYSVMIKGILGYYIDHTDHIMHLANELCM